MNSNFTGFNKIDPKTNNSLFSFGKSNETVQDTGKETTKENVAPGIMSGTIPGTSLNNGANGSGSLLFGNSNSFFNHGSKEETNKPKNKIFSFGTNDNSKSFGVQEVNVSENDKKLNNEQNNIFGSKQEDGVFKGTLFFKPLENNQTKTEGVIDFGTKSDNKNGQGGFWTNGQESKLNFLGKETNIGGANNVGFFGNDKGIMKEKESGSLFSFKNNTKNDEHRFSFPSEKNEEPKTNKFLFGESKNNQTDLGGSVKNSVGTGPLFSFGNKEVDKNCDDKTQERRTNMFGETQMELKPIKISIENKTIDDLITKWSKQLTTSQKIFENYTEKVREWDEHLIQSGDVIMQLNQDIHEADTVQNKIDQHLLFVENQQQELSSILDNYESQADILLKNMDITLNSFNISDLTSQNFLSSLKNNSALTLSENNINTMNSTNKLREKAYSIAEILDEKLDDISGKLRNLINEINQVSDVFNKNLFKDFSSCKSNLFSSDDSFSKESNSKTFFLDHKLNHKHLKADSFDENPVEEIVKLLNLHLNNLKYIEKSEQLLKEKLAKLNRKKK